MKKVHLIVQNRCRNEDLSKLREIGIIHIEKTNAISDGLIRAQERMNRAEEAVTLIQPYKIPKKKKSKIKTEELISDFIDADKISEKPDIVSLLIGLDKERTELEEQLTSLERERDRITGWGVFDPDNFREMASLGFPFFLYELPVESLASIPPRINYIKLSGDKFTVRILVAYREIPGIAPFKLPEKSVVLIDNEIKEIKEKLKVQETRLESFAGFRSALTNEVAEIESDIDFEEALAELERIDGVPQALGCSFLKGYAVAADMEKLKAAAAENGWALLSQDPELEDEVPTKLKNNNFVELITPVTGFLDLVPGYHEKDVSGWFLIFFVIFFGMIFGDAGYGLLLFLIALGGIIVKAKTGVPVILKMLLLLSVSNLTWGIITCAWFGLPVASLPAFLKDISLSALSPAKTDSITINQNLKLFCFFLALIHLTIARLHGVISTLREKSLKIFAELGTLFMVWGIFNVVLVLVVSNKIRAFQLWPFTLHLICGGLFLTFIFGEYEGHIGKSILSGLQNIMSVIFGICNVFSDIMSYIRLWAVGMAGASIAAMVAGMTSPMLGSFLVFLGIILLSFGHGLNILLNVLSVLVHGVRLNILEFSGHAGLSWSGITYKPFAAAKRNLEG
jgi:V/A-type H+-transporting ATPase subunit I